MNETEIIRDALNYCPEFDVFSAEEKQTLAGIAEIHNFSREEEIFTIKHKGEHFYVVLSGKLSLRLKTNKTKSFEKGELFGEIGVFTNKFRLGTIRALEKSELITFHKEKIFDKSLLSERVMLKLVKSLTKKMIGYFYDEDYLSSELLIEKGESESVEFKEGMHSHLREPLTRTLAAFMNLNGGTIFLGVKDDGKIKGLRASNQDFDKFQRDLLSLVEIKLGAYFCTLVTFDVEEIDKKIILRIDCDPSKSPVFFKQKDANGEQRELFIVRNGPHNKTLKRTSKIVAYVQKHFKL